MCSLASPALRWMVSLLGPSRSLVVVVAEVVVGYPDGLNSVNKYFHQENGGGGGGKPSRLQDCLKMNTQMLCLSPEGVGLAGHAAPPFFQLIDTGQPGHCKTL